MFDDYYIGHYDNRPTAEEVFGHNQRPPRKETTRKHGHSRNVCATNCHASTARLHAAEAANARYLNPHNREAREACCQLLENVNGRVLVAYVDGILAGTIIIRNKSVWWADYLRGKNKFDIASRERIKGRKYGVSEDDVRKICFANANAHVGIRVIRNR